ncbi:MAG: sugar ABC transporter permease [Clostridiales bacterium]|nr:sugar ABC transporter permease [Clostridiales bacterium]
MKKKKKRRLNDHTGAVLFFLAPFTILFIIFGLYPMLSSLQISLTDWTFGSEANFIGLENYKNLIFNDPLFWKSVLNTLILMALYIPLSLVVALLLANLIFQKHTKFKRFFQVAFFLPNVTTTVAIGLIFALIFDWQTGFINSTLLKWGVIDEAINWLGQPDTARSVTGLMLFWAYFGYCIVFYLAGMAGISEDLYEAAMIDGAGRWKLLTKITLPNLRSTTSFLLMTSFISGSQVMAEPQLLLNGWASVGQVVGGPERSCLTVVWYLYDVAFGNGTTLRYGKGAAIGYLSFILVMLVVFMWRRVQAVLAKRRGDID